MHTAHVLTRNSALDGAVQQSNAVMTMSLSEAESTVAEVEVAGCHMKECVHIQWTIGATELRTFGGGWKKWPLPKRSGHLPLPLPPKGKLRRRSTSGSSKAKEGDTDRTLVNRTDNALVRACASHSLSVMTAKLRR